MGHEAHKIWIDQCDAAEGILGQFGPGDALDYLVGEKLVNFVRAASTHPEFAAELPNFVAAIRRIFEPYQLQHYFETAATVGNLAPRCSDEDLRTYSEEDALDDDPVSGAEEILIHEQIKALLLVG